MGRVKQSLVYMQMRRIRFTSANVSNGWFSYQGKNREGKISLINN